MLVFLAQQPPKHQPDNLTVADHIAKVLQYFCFRGIEEGTHDDRRIRYVTRLCDKRRVGSLAGSRRAAQKKNLFGKTQILAAILRLEFLPNRLENQLRVFDLEVA